MKDNSGSILTGLFVHGEAQRKSQDAEYDADKKNKALQEKNNDLAESQEKISNLNIELEDEVALLQRHQNSLLEEFSKERDYRNKVVRMHNALLDENAILKEENEHYKKLLCKPMAEIAEKNGNFKETYEKQMEMMADWMVSQKAFKELAIEFGLQQGLSVEDIIEKGKEKELDVLDSKHDPSHNTNANNSSIIRPRINKLKDKHNSNKK